MDIMEIILLAVGGIIFVLSFIIPDRKESGSGNGRALAEDEIKILVKQELESIKGHVDDVVEEAVTYAMEKTERSLERLSNEKIMAVNEYSDTVLAQIHKNHEEVMFLYDMLNNKQINLKNTVSEINRTVKEAEETVTSFQKLAPEAPGSGSRVVESAVPSGSSVPGMEGGQEPMGYADGTSDSNASGGGKQDIVQDQSVREGSASDAAYQETGRSRRRSRDGHVGNKEKILGLYRQGKSAVEIAKELGLGIGEVRLVIDLFK